MTVYVDSFHMILQVPRKWHGGGHMFASDLEELHAFAARLGLLREWYQGDKKPLSFAHYDLTANKRAMAIRLGATVVEPGVIPDDVVRKDPIRPDFPEARS